MCVDGTYLHILLRIVVVVALLECGVCLRSVYKIRVSDELASDSTVNVIDEIDWKL